MAPVTEKARALGFVLSEANGRRSREVLTIAAGSGIVEAGTAIGKITASGKYAPAPDAETTGIEGAETATAICGYTVDATDADVDVACITNDAEVKDPMLIFDDSVDDTTKRTAKLTQLAAVRIKAR
ncbi:head decoration protein [Martelella sp. HB161492]|uniref:head decoration protein n=1 Tax=Martelella sp. HB161492 TaxID=2720726 RepID=UPI0015928221|nr:head decoration protein [Martelella sp. HB161492]